MGYLRLVVFSILVLAAVSNLLDWKTGPAFLAVAALSEISLVLILFRAAVVSRKKLGEGGRTDVWEKAHSLLAEVFSNKIASAVIFEVKIIVGFLKIVSFRKLPRHSQHDEFSFFQGSGYRKIVPVLVLLLIPEAIGVHYLLLKTLSPGAFKETILWLTIFFSIYAAIWVLGDFRFLLESAHLLGDKDLHVRLGMRLRTKVPYAIIESCDAFNPEEKAEIYMTSAEKKVASSLKKISIDAIVWEKANVIITLREAVNVDAIFGLTKNVTRITMYLNDPKAFVDAIRDKIIKKDGF